MKFCRTYITLFIAFVIAVSIGVVRPGGEHVNSGMFPEEFWIKKAFTEEKFDIVIAGDSRVYRGLSPVAINETYPDMSIINYGFSGNGYNEIYLKAVTSRINNGSSKQVIVLGLSTMALTEKASSRNDFLQLISKKKINHQIDVFLSNISAPFRPFELYRYYQLLKQDNRVVKYYQNYHEDGWVSGYKIPDYPDELLSSTKKILQKNKVDQNVIDLVNEYTKKWTESGIRVFAFRVPTTDKMFKLENELSQFNKVNFVRAFSEAGGVWLDFDQSAYHSYDGSHLHKDAAIQLSKDLAAKLVKNGI